MLLRAGPTDRGILAAALALVAAATLALASGYIERTRPLLSDAPAAIAGGAQAATARAAPAPAPARRKRDVPAPATMEGDQRSVVLYLLMEAARPLPLFTR